MDDRPRGVGCVPNRRPRLAPLRGPPGVGYRDPIRRPVHELVWAGAWVGSQHAAAVLHR